MTTADVSVRIAWPEDAEALARVQVDSWAEQYAALLPAGALPSDVLEVASTWRQSLQKPGDARNRVLVALERNRVTGFAVTLPAADPDCDPVRDGEVTELTVAPGERGLGHGSRLLQAAADTLRSDRFTRAVCWLVSTDDVTRAFLTQAGWAADGAHRVLDLTGDGSTTVKQIRLHTSLA